MAHFNKLLSKLVKLNYTEPVYEVEQSQQTTNEEKQFIHGDERLEDGILRFQLTMSGSRKVGGQPQPSTLYTPQQEAVTLLLHALSRRG